MLHRRRPMDKAGRLAYNARMQRLPEGYDPYAASKARAHGAAVYSRHRFRWVRIVVAAVVGAILYRTQIGLPNKHKGLQVLPESYALCADNATIYTVDESTPEVECFLVRKDRIIASGDLPSIEQHWDVYQNELTAKFYGGEPKAKKPLTIVRPARGSIIIPGLTDAHAHLMMYGFKVLLDLNQAQSMDDVLDTLEEHVRSHPDLDDLQWIEGGGWDQTRWKDWRGGFPTAADLAARPLLTSRLIALNRVDVHAMWVSPAALALVADPGEVVGGEVVRYADGSMTGVFVDNAMAVVPKPPWSEAQMEEYLERALQDAAVVGLTSVHDADVEIEMIPVFKKFADEGRLSLRVYGMGHSDAPEYWGSKIPRLEDYGRDGRLNLRSVKLFTDGALGSWGAALLEPYSDNPGTRGLLRSDEETIKTQIKRFWEDGWGINVHCIGDRANNVVLDTFEDVLGNDVREAERRRPRIEHAQIMTLEDIERMGKLGVLASVQPTHATSDMSYAESRLGPERIKGAYAYQSLLQAHPKNILPLGSDFPVEGINPLLGFYAAVARLDASGHSPHGPSGWHAKERLTRAQALKGMTLDAAYAAFAEADVGSLAPGKKADFVVLDRDIMDESAPFAEILEAKVKATVVDGRIVYGQV